jgi:WD40 repeat protein
VPGDGVTATSSASHTFWAYACEEHVVGLGWSPDRRSVLALLADGDAVALDGESGTLLKRWRAHTMGGASLSFHPSGETVATCGHDGVARVWDATDWTQRHELRLPERWGERIAYSPSGVSLAASAGKTIRVWDRAGTPTDDWAKHESTVTDFGWRPGAPSGGKQREMLAATCYGGVTFWQTGYAAPVRTLQWKGSSLRLLWSPNAKYIATGDQDSSVHFWIVKKGEDLQMSGYPIKVRELAWDHTSRYLATGGGSAVTVWDCSGRGPAGTRPVELDSHDGRLGAIAFSHGSLLLASGAEDERVVFWRIGENKKPKPLTETTCSGAVTQLAWSPDDQVLAVATAAGEVRLCAPSS